jgi:HEAT repeat protein
MYALQLYSYSANKAVRRICGHATKKITGERRKYIMRSLKPLISVLLHNEESY